MLCYVMQASWRSNDAAIKKEQRRRAQPWRREQRRQQRRLLEIGGGVKSRGGIEACLAEVYINLACKAFWCRRAK